MREVGERLRHVVAIKQTGHVVNCVNITVHVKTKIISFSAFTIRVAARIEHHIYFGS